MNRGRLVSIQLSGGQAPLPAATLKKPSAIDDTPNTAFVNTVETKGIIGAFYINDLYIDSDGTILIPSDCINRTNADKGEDWFINYYISPYKADFTVEESDLIWPGETD